MPVPARPPSDRQQQHRTTSSRLQTTAAAAAAGAAGTAPRIQSNNDNPRHQLGLFESGLQVDIEIDEFSNIRHSTDHTHYTIETDSHKLDRNWTHTAQSKQAIPRAAHPVTPQCLRTCSTTTRATPVCLPQAAPSQASYYLDYTRPCLVQSGAVQRSQS